MKSKKSDPLSTGKVYAAAIGYLRKNSAIFIPFFIFFIFDFISLAVLYLAPRMPLKLLFGPPIRTFWGEEFLHYPMNFLLLSQLSSLSRMVIGVVFGSLLTGMAVAMISDVYNKKQIHLKDSFKASLKRYFDLFAIVLIFTLLFYFLQKFAVWGLVKYFVSGRQRLFFVGAKLWLGPGLLCLNFILAAFIQAAFVYAIPFIIIGKNKLFKSMIKSFGLFGKFFIRTLILVSLPMFVYIPISILQSKSSILITKFFPESVLLLLILGSLISSLVIDLLVTVSTTCLYLMNEEKIGTK
ncbi:MAG: hypothetical protein WC532_02670 [Candidatus Omnitrophota bacterium]